MEQKQIKQFTFYDLYAELMDVLNDEERGKLLRRMCEYMFTEEVQKELTDKKLIFLWGEYSRLLRREQASTDERQNCTRKQAYGALYILPQLL